jgi:hypothetical protein
MNAHQADDFATRKFTVENWITHNGDAHPRESIFAPAGTSDFPLTLRDIIGDALQAAIRVFRQIKLDPQ